MTYQKTLSFQLVFALFIVLCLFFAGRSAAVIALCDTNNPALLYSDRVLGSKLDKVRIESACPLVPDAQNRIMIRRSVLSFSTGAHNAFDAHSAYTHIRSSAVTDARFQLRDGRLVIENCDFSNSEIVLSGNAGVKIFKSKGGGIRLLESFTGTLDLFHSPGWQLTFEGGSEYIGRSRHWSFDETSFGPVRLVASPAREYLFYVRENKPLIIANIDRVALKLFFARENGELREDESACAIDADDALVLNLFRPGTPSNIRTGNIAVNMVNSNLVRCALAVSGSTILTLENGFVDTVSVNDDATLYVFDSLVRELCCGGQSDVQVYDSQIVENVHIREHSTLTLENSYPADYFYENRDTDFYFYLDGNKYEALNVQE